MFATIALALFAMVLLFDLGMRAAIQRRRTGNTGIRLPSTREQCWARATLGLGVLLPGVAAPIAELLGVPALAALDQPAIRIAGIVLTLVGVGASAGAQQAMGPSWRTTVDSTERPALVTGGVFRIVRNPIYTAMIIMVVGLTMVVPNAIALAGLGMMLVGAQVQVRLIEEPYLRRIHDRAYRDYAAHVGRFLPGIGRLRSTDIARGAIGFRGGR